MAYTKAEFVAEFILHARPRTGGPWREAIRASEELYELILERYPEVGHEWDGRPVPTPEPPKETPKETKTAPVATGGAEVGKKKKRK